MIISQKQLEPFAQHNLKKFEDEMVLHITDFAPNSAKALKEKGVRKVVQLGMQNANKYGFTKKGPVRFYIEMMFMFGSYFDTDFQYPWIQKVLNDREITSQMARADLLHFEMMKYFENAIGHNAEYATTALIQSNQLQASNFEEVNNDAMRYAFNQKIRSTMQETYPQKASFLGDDLLDQVIASGFKLAHHYKIDSLDGKLLFITLVFSIGHRFDIDPQYPWIGNTLIDDKSAISPNQKAENLKKKMEIYVLRTLKNLK